MMLLPVLLLAAWPRAVSQTVNPPLMSLVATYVGPTSNPNNEDTIHTVCVPHMLLLSDMRLQTVLWINTTHPELTAKFYYTGVIAAADNIFRTDVCRDIIYAYEYVFYALAEQGQVIPLDAYATAYAIENGTNPITDVIPQFLYAARITLRGDSTPHMYFFLDRVQNLALAGNITSLDALGERRPPPLNNSYGWPLPLGSSWSWPKVASITNRLFDELKIKRAFQNEICESSTMLQSIASSVGASLIKTDGSYGWDDPRFEAAVAASLAPIMEGKPDQLAQWLYMNDTLMQRFMMDPPEAWPPSRPLPMSLDTCKITNQSPGLAVLTSGGGAALQRFRSAGPTGVLQHWGIGISSRSKYPDRAWSFIAFTINCNNPVWKTYMLNANKIPNYQHCLVMPEFQAKIAASSSMQNSLAERDKSFPLTHPGPPINAHLIENLSLHSRFLGRLGRCMMPDFNWTGYRVPDYAEFPSEWGKAVRWPLPPGYDRSKCIKEAIKEAGGILKFIHLPTCGQGNIRYAISGCQGDRAEAVRQWAVTDANVTCMAGLFANWTLANNYTNIMTDCPYYTAGSDLGQAALILGAIMTLLVLAMYVVMYRNWNAKILRVSSRLITLLYLAGIAILAWSPALFLVSCTGFMATLTNGIFTVVSAMFVKLLRVMSIFWAGERFRQTKIFDPHLIAIMLAILALNNVILLTWHFTRDHDFIVTPVPGHQILPVLQCNMGGVGYYVTWLLLLTILLMVSVYFAWRMSKYRGHSDLEKAVQDSKALLASAAAMILLIMATAFILATNRDWKAFVLIQLLSIESICFLLLVVYFVPRLIQLKFDPNASEEGTIGPDRRDPISVREAKTQAALAQVQSDGTGSAVKITFTHSSKNGSRHSTASAPASDTQPVSQVAWSSEARNTSPLDRRPSGSSPPRDERERQVLSQSD